MTDIKKAQCECGAEFEWYYKTSPKQCLQCKGKDAVKINKALHKKMFKMFG